MHFLKNGNCALHIIDGIFQVSYLINYYQFEHKYIHQDGFQGLVQIRS